MTEKDTQTRLWQEITGMVVAAVIRVMAAWLLVPVPVRVVPVVLPFPS